MSTAAHEFLEGVVLNSALFEFDTEANVYRARCVDLHKSISIYQLYQRLFDGRNIFGFGLNTEQGVALFQPGKLVHEVGDVTAATWDCINDLPYRVVIDMRDHKEALL